MKKMCILAGLKKVELENNKVDYDIVCEFTIYDTTTFDEIGRIISTMRADYLTNYIRVMWYDPFMEHSYHNIFNIEKMKDFV